MSRPGAARRALAASLCATGLLVALLPGVAAARADGSVATTHSVQAGPSGAIISNGEDLVKAGDGCAVIRQGDQTISAGDCSHAPSSKRGANTPPTGATRANAPHTTGTPAPNGTTGTAPRAMPTTASLTDGTTSESTARTEDRLCPSSAPKDAVKATVERAVDGDTLQIDRKIEGTDRVRLSGVDTPELHGKNGRPEPYAGTAKNFTSDSLAGKSVLLAADKDKTDDYHRLLAYVWTTPGDGIMGRVKGMLGDGPTLFNRTLLDKGYAKVMTIPPNDRYASCFEAAQSAARSSGEGRWAAAGSTMPASTALTADPQPTDATTSPTTTMPPTSMQTTTAATSPSTDPETTSSPTTADETNVPDTSNTMSVPTTVAGTTSTQDATTVRQVTTPDTTNPTSASIVPTTPEPTATATTVATTSQEAPPVTQPEPAVQVAPAPAPPTLPDTWPPPAAGSPSVRAAPDTIPYQSLPVNTTPTGETQHLLPDTGGRSPVFLLLGAALVGAGLLIWRGRPNDYPESWRE